MAIKKYSSGAWQECTTMKKYVSGAWQSCNACKKYVSGAWQDVWTSSLTAIFGKSTLTASEGNYDCYGSNSDCPYGFNPYVYYDVNEIMDGSGYVQFYVDGNWTNPKIEFDWKGFYYHDFSSGARWNSYKAGTISVLYGQSSSSNLTEKVVVDTIRASDKYGYYTNKYDTASWDAATGQVSTTLSGTFTRIGFRIKLYSFIEANPDYSENNDTSYEAGNDIMIYNTKINGVNIEFPKPSI